MNALASIIRAIDRLNELVGRVVAWLTLGTVSVCFLVVVLRYVFSIGFVWLQELYVWQHALVFMLAAGYTLRATSGTLQAATSGGFDVFFVVTATDDTDPQPVVACVPPSGSTFAIGTTTVGCTARDASGNVARGSFDVTVRSADEQLAECISDCPP